MIYQHFDRAESIIYSNGWKARQEGEPKSPPGYLGWGQRHYWLAGYSDAEIAIEGPTTQREGNSHAGDGR
jgi:hypothetical protein